MNYKNLKIVSRLAISVFVIVRLSCCKGIKAPAPLGTHDEYSSTSVNLNYQTNLNKESLLLILAKENVIIKSGRLNNYDPPWDSLRYILGNITCDNQKREAYIEFKDKKATNTTLQILWFNAVPTKDEKEYKRRTEKYYKCFEVLFKKTT